jgi:hypothetical protein
VSRVRNHADETGERLALLTRYVIASS